MTKILIAESLDLETLKTIIKEKSAFLHEVTQIAANFPEHEIHFSYQPNLTPEQLEEEIKSYNALIVRPKQVTTQAIQNAKDLKLIIRGGAGVNSIDLKQAKKQKIVVENTPGQNSIATAEYSFNLIMEILGNRQIERSNNNTHAGKEEQPEDYMGQELAGKKIGIIGMGNTGLALAKRAAAFDMEVCYYNRSLKEVDYIHFDNLKNLLESQPDVISLHIPLNKETEGIIGTEEFALMKQGTVLINCARPQLVDLKAFAWALEEGIIASAGIDGDYDVIEPFVQADTNHKCIITHHIADCTQQAQEKITTHVLDQTFAFFREEKEVNRVV